MLPNELREVHAFHDKIEKMRKFKLDLALLSTPKTPTLKEKLFKSQKGLCHLCKKTIEFEYLHYNSTHIHHIQPIKKGGNRQALKNLALTHS
jgi:hypothetical protein